MKIITSNHAISVVIVPNYKNKNIAKDTKYVQVYPLSITRRNLEQETQKKYERGLFGRLT